MYDINSRGRCYVCFGVEEVSAERVLRFAQAQFLVTTFIDSLPGNTRLLLHLFRDLNCFADYAHLKAFTSPHVSTVRSFSS